MGLDVESLGVADEDGIRTAVHEMRRSGRPQDLAVLGDDLPLLLGIAVWQEDIDLGQGVEGDRMRVDVGDRCFAGDVRRHLAFELSQGIGAVPETDW